MSWLLCFWVLITAVVFLLHLYFSQIRRFWENLKVPHTSFLFPLGHFQRGGWSQNMGVLLTKFYREFRGERFFGIWMFTNPVLIIKDPELIKTIFVKDFMYFHDRGIHYNEKEDPLSAHLFALEGLKWKNLRAKLSPTFTSGKMKMMFPLLVKCSEELIQYLKGPAEKGETIDVKEVAALYTTDVISLCAFGIETNSLKHPGAIFRKMGKKVVEPSLRNFVNQYLRFSAPKIAQFIGLKFLSKEPADFFLNAVQEVMESRKENKIQRNDFLQLLIQLKDDGIIKNTENENYNEIGTSEDGVKLTFEEAAAQAFVFFVAGFETSSSTIQFALYELAKNPEIQENLRTEILNSLAKHKGVPTYELVCDLPYLNKVIDETLRKYPVAPMLQRKCNKNYEIPDSDVIIPKGTLVFIPIYGIQMDEKYFPDPEKFDPERFSEQEKQKRHNYTYLPFGEGPRNCIGKRFGQMQVRLALIVLLQNFKFQLSEELKKPIKFDARTFVLSTKGGMPLKISSL